MFIWMSQLFERAEVLITILPIRWVCLCILLSLKNTKPSECILSSRSELRKPVIQLYYQKLLMCRLYLVGFPDSQYMDSILFSPRFFPASYLVRTFHKIIRIDLQRNNNPTYKNQLVTEAHNTYIIVKVSKVNMLYWTFNIGL